MAAVESAPAGDRARKAVAKGRPAPGRQAQKPHARPARANAKNKPIKPPRKPNPVSDNASSVIYGFPPEHLSFAMTGGISRDLVDAQRTDARARISASCGATGSRVIPSDEERLDRMVGAAPPEVVAPGGCPPQRIKLPDVLEGLTEPACCWCSTGSGSHSLRSLPAGRRCRRPMRSSHRRTSGRASMPAVKVCLAPADTVPYVTVTNLAGPA